MPGPTLITPIEQFAHETAVSLLHQERLGTVSEPERPQQRKRKTSKIVNRVRVID